MKKYFIYELKKNVFPLAFLTVIALIAYTFPLLLEDTDVFLSDVDLVSISTLGGVLAVFMPVAMFGYRMKKRSVDLYFSLPISHTKILITKYLLGLILIFAPYTAAYWLGAFIVMGKAFKYINAVWYLPQFFGSIIPIYMIYSISAFLFTRANKAIDGIMFVVFGFCAVPLVDWLFYQLFNAYNEYSSLLFAFAPLDQITSFTAKHITNSYYYYTMSQTQTNFMIVGFLLNTLFSIGSTVGIIKLEKRTKAENVSQISESIFGYKTMIPLYTVCFLGLCDLPFSFNAFLIIMISIGMYTLTIAYKRTFRIGKKQLIILIVSIVLGIILAMINTYVH